MTSTMRCDAAFKQIVLGNCYDALAQSGFTRFRKHAVDWPFGNDFHCWVGLNSAVFPQYVEINPFVGVHVIPIEKLWTGLKVGRYPAEYNRHHATYALHLGELAPEEPVFRFTRDSDVVALASRLTQLYIRVGLRYAESISDYERLLPLLHSRVERLGAYPERYACCLYLLGRVADARMFTEDFVKRRRDYFEGFATPFLKRLAN